MTKRISQNTPDQSAFIAHLPLHKNQFGGYLLLGISCIALFAIDYLFSTNIDELLHYDRASLHNFEYWRLLSAHLLHTNEWHLLLNMLGLILLWLLHGDYANTKNLLIQTSVLALCISICLYFFTPKLNAYVGMSGVLHGLFVIGAMIDILLRKKTGYLLLIGIAIKVIDEQISPPDSDLQALIEANVVIDAHLYGVIFGIIVGTFLLSTHKNEYTYK